MIGLVELKNWRAYEDTAIDMGSRVVFFVAPNGVGKSSLMEAVRWCLLGEPVSRKAKAAVRLGARSATVAVEVGLSQPDQTLRVERSLSPAGKATFAASLDGRAIQEDNYAELLADRWRADHGLIDRLMFTDPHLPAAKSAFPVRDHLAATLGVKPLLEAAARLRAARKDIAKRVSVLRRELGQVEADTASHQATVSSAAADLKAIAVQRLTLAGELQQAEAAALLARRWDEYRDAVAVHNDEVAEILAELSEVIEVDAVEPQFSLADARDDASALLDEVRESKAEREITRARSAGASELLANPTTMCPTCLRPLSEHERLSALAQHGEVVAGAEGDARKAVEAESAAQDRLNTLAAFMSRLATLREPSSPTNPDPGSEAVAHLLQLRESAQSLAEEAGRLQGIAAAEADRASFDVRLRQARGALQSAVREEQLLSIAIDVFDRLADKTLRDRIDPLIRELSSRWKVLFGTDGLTLEPSGELTVNSAGGTLSINDLSGGERATAIVIARLLVTASTTRVPTVWFDEPLEHLDPRRRAAVARTIVRAGQTDTVAQLIVSTYEDRIARQLAAADPDNVRVVHADVRPHY